MARILGACWCGARILTYSIGSDASYRRHTSLGMPGSPKSAQQQRSGRDTANTHLRHDRCMAEPTLEQESPTCCKHQDFFSFDLSMHQRGTVSFAWWDPQARRNRSALERSHACRCAAPGYWSVSEMGSSD